MVGEIRYRIRDTSYPFVVSISCILYLISLSGTARKIRKAKREIDSSSPIGIMKNVKAHRFLSCFDIRTVDGKKTVA